MQIDKKDLQDLQIIVTKYRRLHDQISDLEDKLNKLSSEKDSLISKLLEVRDSEQNLISNIKDKYPDIIIDDIIKSLIDKN